MVGSGQGYYEGSPQVWAEAPLITSVHGLAEGTLLTRRTCDIRLQEERNYMVMFVMLDVGRMVEGLSASYLETTTLLAQPFGGRGRCSAQARAGDRMVRALRVSHRVRTGRPHQYMHQYSRRY